VSRRRTVLEDDSIVLHFGRSRRIRIGSWKPIHSTLVDRPISVVERICDQVKRWQGSDHGCAGSLPLCCSSRLSGTSFSHGTHCESRIRDRRRADSPIALRGSAAMEQIANNMIERLEAIGPQTGPKIEVID
jgi:hypothetical protein